MLAATATTPGLLLIVTVAVVGVLHTVVPDHWMPIALLARQRGWSKGETALAALKAASGHVVTTLIIGVMVWLAGVAFATRFGHIVDISTSIALVSFGGWITIGAWRELHKTGQADGEGGLFGHSHAHHGYDHGHGGDDGCGHLALVASMAPSFDE